MTELSFLTDTEKTLIGRLVTGFEREKRLVEFGKKREENLSGGLTRAINLLNFLLRRAMEESGFGGMLRRRREADTDQRLELVLWRSPVFESDEKLYQNGIVLLWDQRMKGPEICAYISDTSMQNAQIQSLLTLQIEEVRSSLDLVRVIIEACGHGH